MIASLPMYDRPKLTAAHAQLWHLIRDGLIAAGYAAPDALDQIAEGPEVWLSEELVFSQACGMPYRKFLHDRVTLIGTPDYGVTGCPAGYYNSILIARCGHFPRGLAEANGAALAFNSPLSQSGYAAALVGARLAGIGYGAKLETGAHVNSIDAIKTNKADIAAIDAVTWRYFCAFEDTSGLCVLAQTPPTPALPYITHRQNSGSTFFDIVETAIATLPRSTRSLLGLKGLIAIPASAYLDVPDR